MRHKFKVIATFGLFSLCSLPAFAEQPKYYVDLFINQCSFFYDNHTLAVKTWDNRGAPRVTDLDLGPLGHYAQSKYTDIFVGRLIAGQFFVVSSRDHSNKFCTVAFSNEEFDLMFFDQLAAGLAHSYLVRNKTLAVRAENNSVFYQWADDLIMSTETLNLSRDGQFIVMSIEQKYNL